MLDELLRVGFALPPPDESRDGLIVMIRGAAGTGKSTLALQLAANMEFFLPPATPGTGKSDDAKASRAPAQAAPGLLRRAFFSLEQDAKELKAIYCRMIVNQSRAHRGLRCANLPERDDSAHSLKQDVLSVQEVLDLLGRPDAKDTLRKMVNKALQWKNDSDHPVQDQAVELRDQINDERIVFNAKPPPLGKTRMAKTTRRTAVGSSNPSQHLKAAPLALAYDYLESFEANLDREERPIIFVDGLSILSEEDRERLEMGALIDSLRSRALIGVIAYEPSVGGEESLDHQVDVVIELEERHLSTPIDYIVHQLHFKKTRYQEAALGWHQYKIRGYGLEIYPSIHFQVHSHLYMTSQLVRSLTPVKPKGTKDSPKELYKRETLAESGWSVIEQVLGGINPGDSIALLGPRGAFKTALTLDFLFRSRCQPSDKKHPGETNAPYKEDACAPGQPCPTTEAQHGLLVSVIDNEDTLRIHKSCPMVREAVAKGAARGKCDHFAQCCNHGFLFYQRPGAIASPEFLYYLKTRLQVANPPIQRLAFWDLTQLEHRFPLLANDPMFVPALLDLFKIKMLTPKDEPERRVKSVFMGAANARLSNIIAAVADNVLFCWRDRVRSGLPQDEHGRRAVDDVVDRVWRATGEKAKNRVDYLMIYVDRTSGGFAQERKNLFAFPILSGFQLFVPCGPWSRSDYAVNSEEVPFFEQSEGQILHVTEMQGFASSRG